MTFNRLALIVLGSWLGNIACSPLTIVLPSRALPLGTLFVNILSCLPIDYLA